jgi:hypothetical protein
LDIYDINMHMIKFEEQINHMYDMTIDEYLYRDCPEKILNKNRNGLRQRYIQWMYENTQKGNELDYLYKMYNSLIH